MKQIQPIEEMKSTKSNQLLSNQDTHQTDGFAIYVTVLKINGT